MSKFAYISNRLAQFLDLPQYTQFTRYQLIFCFLKKLRLCGTHIVNQNTDYIYIDDRLSSLLELPVGSKLLIADLSKTLKKFQTTERPPPYLPRITKLKRDLNEEIRHSYYAPPPNSPLKN